MNWSKHGLNSCGYIVNSIKIMWAPPFVIVHRNVPSCCEFGMDDFYYYKTNECWFQCLSLTWLSRMSPCNLHALTVCLISWLSFAHTTATPQIIVFVFVLFFFLPCIHPSIHLSIPSSVHPSLSPCLVRSVLWRNRSAVFSLSLCVFTPLSKKLNKELNQGHHLWLLCASMTSL